MHATSRPGFAVAAALMAALSVGRAAAQDQTQNSELPSYQIPGWSFTPAVGIGIVYDTNVALSSPRASIGETQGDTLFTIIPAGQVEFVGKQTGFSANYRGGLRRYVEVSGLDGFDQRGSVGFNRGWSRRLSTFANAGYVESPTTDEVELNGVPFRRAGSRRTTAAVGSSFRLTKFLTWSARYDTTRATFEQPDIFLVGGSIHGLRNGLSHQLTERLQVGAEYSYRTASLDEGGELGVEENERHFAFHDAGGLVSFAVSPHTTLSAASGFGMLNDKTAGETRSGPYVRLGIVRDFERATAGINFERQYVPAFGIGGSSSSQGLHGYLRMPLARNRVYAQLAGGWRRTIPFAAASLQLDTFVFRSTVGYAAARWARVEGVYGYTRQDTIVTGGEVDRHRLGVQFVVSQPMRIR